MSIDAALSATYSAAAAERDAHVDAILAHAAARKVVVAGPGTGKTYLFRQLVETNPNTLTLTFINALVEDLSLSLSGLSNVRTLHSFAREKLARVTRKDVRIFPNMAIVVRDDARIVLRQDIDFDAILRNRDDQNQLIAFYRRRRTYYGHYGMTDVVYAITRYWEEHPNKICTYDQIVVDEFQDFNRLEVSLIDLLATKSRILLAGDDDQALYKFKDADPCHIRQKHGPTDPSFEGFCLPFCQRCTRAIVEATNDVLRAATARSLLKGRIVKRFDYFPSAKNDLKSASHPQLEYRQAHAGQIPWRISQCIAAIATAEREAFSILVISPFRKQLETVVAGLKKKGFSNITHVSRDRGSELTLMDGLRILLDDPKDNLGWRIASRILLDQPDFEDLVKASDGDIKRPVFELISQGARKDVKRFLKALRALRDDKATDPDEIDELLVRSGYEPSDFPKAALARLAERHAAKGNAAVRRLPVTATTVQGSKGLAADYVFITHFEDRYFIEAKDKAAISDRDVCSFIVALTRARKKVFLIGPVSAKRPTFLTWIRDQWVQQAGDVTDPDDEGSDATQP